MKYCGDYSGKLRLVAFGRGLNDSGRVFQIIIKKTYIYMHRIYEKPIAIQISNTRLALLVRQEEKARLTFFCRLVIKVVLL